jgi:hypothetical protein
MDHNSYYVHINNYQPHFNASGYYLILFLITVSQWNGLWNTCLRITSDACQNCRFLGLSPILLNQNSWGGAQKHILRDFLQRVIDVEV